MDRRGKRAVFEEETINRAKMIVEEFSYNDQKMIAISVLLAGVLHLTSEQIGLVFGISPSTVIRMNERFRKEKQGVPGNWGGDRRSILPSDDTAEVLASLESQASQGKIVVVEQVKLALEDKLGNRISLQTSYNVLHRNGWRKVKPDKEHPKSDPQKQEEFKKNIPRCDMYGFRTRTSRKQDTANNVP